ncbi:RNA recognition motif domain-containing protein [Catenovulum maritimum]|uniref:RNA-binding protein n=1 Tax=Catenovulum maritimum TaxID=1513271 RepID=A0A0J8GRA6_9ALTE|nr:RNA-binding protein [Catenovulum maritimum]KMT63769.1 RNA-binding protein [Catenovulum maritimum]
MSNPIMKQAVVTIVLALISFFVLPALSVQLEANVAISLGIIVGGTIAMLLSPSSANDSGDSTEAVETKTLYVGNLPYRANEAAVKELFEKYGTVTSVRLMRDRNTGKRKGFGFVEISANAIVKAVEELNDSEFQQRTLKVREAKDKVAKDTAQVSES